MDLGDAILMPGLINAHSHLELTVLRGFLDGLEFPAWINALATTKRGTLTPDMLLDSARYGIEEGIRAGVTCYADTGEAAVVAAALCDYGVRGLAYQEVFGPDPSVSDRAVEALERSLAAARALESSLVRIGISPHAPYTVSDALFRATASLAARERLPVAVHIAESAAEGQLVREAIGPFADGLRARGIAVVPRARSPIELLEKTGVLDLRPLLIHCVQTDAEDVHRIASHGCPVAHCPASNAKLGHGTAPMTALLAARVTVALGSDSVISNDRMDMLGEARLAILLQRAAARSATSLSAAAALQCLTMGGAKALGLESEVGSLEEGKSADLAAFPTDGRGPIHDPATAAIWAMAGGEASFAMVAGRTVLEGGRLIRRDESLVNRIEDVGHSLRDWARQSLPLSLRRGAV